MSSITLRTCSAVVITFVLIAAVAGADDESRAIGKKALAFSVEDQFEKKWTWESNYKGKPTVLVLSDWKGSDYLTNWTKPLLERFKGRIQFVAFADVSLAPSFMHGTIRGMFRESFKYSIMMDFTGDVFKYYNVRAGVPNVVYIDESETVRLHTWGKGSPEYVKAFADHLEKTIHAADR